jgi:hypothetical protein
VQAGLDAVTSAVCGYQLRFQLDVLCSSFVLNFNKKLLISSGSGQTNIYFPSCTKPPDVSGHYHTKTEFEFLKAII